MIKLVCCFFYLIFGCIYDVKYFLSIFLGGKGDIIEFLEVKNGRNIVEVYRKGKVKLIMNLEDVYCGNVSFNLIVVFVWNVLYFLLNNNWFVVLVWLR